LLKIQWHFLSSNPLAHRVGQFNPKGGSVYSEIFRLRQIYWFIAEYEADEEWWICLMLNYKIMLDEPEGFTHLIGVSSGIYDPYRVKPVFGLLNSIYILTLRDNEEIAFVLRERTVQNSMF